LYAAQIIPQIDTEIAEKGYFWMKTNSSFAPLIYYKVYKSAAGPEVMFKVKTISKAKAFHFFQVDTTYCSIIF
jgi:hypothetical protein